MTNVLYVVYCPEDDVRAKETLVFSALIWKLFCHEQACRITLNFGMLCTCISAWHLILISRLKKNDNHQMHQLQPQLQHPFLHMYGGSIDCRISATLDCNLARTIGASL